MLNSNHVLIYCRECFSVTSKCQVFELFWRAQSYSEFLLHLAFTPVSVVHRNV